MAHIRSILPQRGGVSPVDNNTTALFHYDEHVHDNLKGLRALGETSSLSFDGVDDWVSLGNFGLSSLTSCTVEFWHKTTKDANILLFQGQTSGYYLWARRPGVAFYHAQVGTPTVYRDGEVATNILVDGKWHHYAITNVNLSTWTTIKLSNYGSFHFHGELEGLRVWNTSLTQDDIKLSMRGGLNETKPVGFWKMNEGQGNLVFDHSGNGNDGIVYGGAWKEGRAVYSLISGGYPGGTGKGVLLEDGTTNLVTSPFLTNNPNYTTGSSSLVQETFNVNGEIMQGITLNQGLSTDIISINIPHGQATGQTTFSIWFKSTKANPLKGQVKCTVDGVVYWLDNNDTWISSGAFEKNNLFSGYTDIGNWQRVTYTFPPFPAGVLSNINFTNGFYRTSADLTVSLANAQLEQKTYATSFVNGTRLNSNLQYPIDMLNATEGTINFWAKLDYSLPHISGSSNDLWVTTSGTYGGASSLNMWAQNNMYADRIIGIHWGGTNGSQNHVAPALSATPQYVNGGWNMYTISWKNTEGYKAYINGVLVGLGNANLPLKPFESSVIDFKGMTMDELRIDKVQRTDLEITSWYYQGRNGW